MRMEEIDWKKEEDEKGGKKTLRGESERRRGGAKCTRTPAGQTGSVAVRLMKLVFSQVCVCMDVRMNTWQLQVDETRLCVHVSVRV